MKRFTLLVTTLALVALVASGAMAQQQKVWKQGITPVSMAFSNTTGVVPSFNGGSSAALFFDNATDSYANFMVAAPAACDRSALKSVTLTVAMNEAFTTRGTNASHNVDGTRFEAYYKGYNPLTGVSASWQSLGVSQYNRTGVTPSSSAGETMEFTFPSSAVNFGGGGLVIVQVSRNATNSQDTSNINYTPLGLSYKWLYCPDAQ